MLTPQQIDQVYFGTVKFGGYDKQDVDEFLGQLADDYITLYKENALLKSKMKVLVSKLEEYRSNPASVDHSVTDTKKACEQMLKETEEKCAQMLAEAGAAAQENTRDVDALIAAENDKIEEAKRVATAKITELQEQLQACLQSLEDIKSANVPLPGSPVLEQDSSEPNRAAALADEIAANLEILVGTTDEVAPAPEPQHPTMESTTSRFTNLKFGRNYEDQ